MNRKLISGWGRYPRLESREVFPKSPRHLTDYLKACYHPRGLGRSYGDAGLPAKNHVSVNSQYLNAFIHFDQETGILTAEAGVSLFQVLKYFIPKGYFLPVTPGTQFVTLGGAVASNVHGKNHHRRGSIENFIEEAKVHTEAGPITCSLKRNSDLYKGTISGYGLTGMIESVKIRLKKIETAYIREQKIAAPDLETLFRMFEKHDNQYEYSVAWLDTLARGRHMGRGILMLGEHAVVSDLNEKQKGDPLKYAGFSNKNVPFDFPQWIMNGMFLGLFNIYFYVKGKRQQETNITDLLSFFYPLDSIQNWNRMYGRNGFFQYQLMIPDPHGEEGISACLSYLSERCIGSFLSVLKRCGEDKGILPFARKGYTLALDIPFRSNEILKSLDRLDELVLKYGGRVYLSKDARLPAAVFKAMYPEHVELNEILNRYNLNLKTRSHMAERLQL